MTDSEAPSNPEHVTAAAAFLSSLLEQHEDMGREGLQKTPQRLAKAMGELIEGYGVNLEEMFTTFESEGDAMVIVRDIPFASLCEHHVLPFTGTVSVAYVPSERIVGLSKIPRVVRAITRRLQVQERIGVQLTDLIDKMLKPTGVMVVVRAHHTCMAIRGVESPGEMLTSVVRGCFKEKAEARAEAIRLFEGGRR